VAVLQHRRLGPRRRQPNTTATAIAPAPSTVPTMGRLSCEQLSVSFEPEGGLPSLPLPDNALASGSADHPAISGALGAGLVLEPRPLVEGVGV